jgi:hypothetical protein
VGPGVGLAFRPGIRDGRQDGRRDSGPGDWCRGPSVGTGFRDRREGSWSSGLECGTGVRTGVRLVGRCRNTASGRCRDGRRDGVALASALVWGLTRDWVSGLALGWALELVWG